MNTWLQQFWAGLSGEFFDLSDGTQVGQMIGRVLVAAVLGAILVYERVRQGKSAGVRTHTLVSVAAVFFVIVPQQMGATPPDLTRVVQGTAARVGFLGPGASSSRTTMG